MKSLPSILRKHLEAEIKRLSEKLKDCKLTERQLIEYKLNDYKQKLENLTENEKVS